MLFFVYGSKEKVQKLCFWTFTHLKTSLVMRTFHSFMSCLKGRCPKCYIWWFSKSTVCFLLKLKLIVFLPIFSSILWGKRTNQRCCSVSSWWRIKGCTVELPTWTSFATFTERSDSCSPNRHPLAPSLGRPQLSWERPGVKRPTD